MKNVKVIEELHRISDKNGGLLLPQHVVREARNPRSVLHSRFEWDNTKAAEEHRLWQARQLISICVEIIPGTSELTQAYVSVSSDRAAGGGYRATVQVLSDTDLRRQFLQDALAELNTFQKKFARIKALAGIFSEIRKVTRKAA